MREQWRDPVRHRARAGAWTGWARDRSASGRHSCGGQGRERRAVRRPPPL